jgi:PAS domain S-box-containing protein
VAGEAAGQAGDRGAPAAGLRGAPLARPSLRAHLVVLVLAAVLPMVVFTAWLTANLSGERRAAVERESQDTARAVANNIDRQLSATIATLNLLGMSRNLLEGDLARFRDDAARRVTTQSQWRAVFLRDGDGRELMSTLRPRGETGSGHPPSDRESMTRAIATGLPSVGPLEPGAAYFTVDVPIYQDVRLRYVLTALISPGSIRDILVEQKLSPERFGIVVDPRGRVVARSLDHDAFVGRPSSYQVSGPPGALATPWERGADGRGMPVYYTRARSNVSGWTAVVAMPTVVVDRPFWRSVGAVATGGLGFLLLGLLVAALLGRRLTGPLSWLAASASDLCSGRLRSHPPTRIAEVQSVASALLDAGTQRAEAERALRDREEQLSAILNQATAGIVRTDSQGRFSFVNDRFCEIVGRRRDDLFSLHLADIVAPDGAPPVRAALAELAATGGSRTLETRFLRPTGQVIWTSVSLSRFREPGLPGSMLAVVIEITDRKAAEAERTALLARERLARAEAEKANHAKDEFLATLSHELRTPLNALRLWAGVLRQQPVDPDTLAKAVDTIDRNAALQAQLIDDLLDISRIASGKLRLELRPIDLRTVIESAVETVRGPAEDKGLTLARALDPDVGPVLGDATRLQQVLWNLLTNALKFTPTGGRIEIILRRRGGAAELAVRDSGQGISPALLPRIFDRFHQGDSSTTRPQGGLGLGLAIARQLVELHGGTIRAESAGEGRGTTVTVALPLTRAAGEEPPGARVPTDGMPVALTGLRVLFVDDDGDAREASAMSLGRAGATVVTAASVAEAMRELESKWPDVIVSDIGMPGEDGVSLIGRVRRLEAAAGRPRTPAIALTAYASEDDAARILAAGYQVHVAKPVEPQRLVEVLHKARADAEVTDGAPPR